MVVLLFLCLNLNRNQFNRIPSLTLSGSDALTECFCGFFASQNVGQEKHIQVENHGWASLRVGRGLGINKQNAVQKDLELSAQQS